MSRVGRFLLVAAVATASLLVSPASRADDTYPNRLVRVIVAFPPGSTLDALTRIVTEQLSRKWGQSVVIENISGGGGNIGTERFARSEPDGYTLMFSPPGPVTINPLLYGDAAPDPTKFTPIAVMATVPTVLVVRRDFPANAIPDLIARAKASPGKLTYASQGAGSTGFLTAKLFETRAGVEMLHVPYRGAGPLLSDLVAGHIDMAFGAIVTAIPLHRNGTGRIMAVASERRSAAVPEVATIADTLPGFRAATFFACVAPANTPAAIADKISRDIAAVLRQPDVNARLREMMFEPVGSTPAETAQFFAEETALWGKIIKETNASAQ